MTRRPCTFRDSATSRAPSRPWWRPACRWRWCVSIHRVYIEVVTAAAGGASFRRCCGGATNGTACNETPAEIRARGSSIGTAGASTSGAPASRGRSARLAVVAPIHGGIRSGARGPAGEIGSDAGYAGTIRALAVSLLQFARFSVDEPSTQSVYRNIIDRLCAQHGDKRVAICSANTS